MNVYNTLRSERYFNIEAYTNNEYKIENIKQKLQYVISSLLKTNITSTRCTALFINVYFEILWIEIECDIPFQYSCVVCEVNKRHKFDKMLVYSRSLIYCNSRSVFISITCVSTISNNSINILSLNIYLPVTKLQIYLSKWSFGDKKRDKLITYDNEIKHGKLIMTHGMHLQNIKY